MLAALLTAPGPIAAAPLALVERDPPVPGPGELLLRVAACAVCRTDLQVCEGEVAVPRLPIVPGHQAVGRVEAVGPGVEGWAPGDRAGAGGLGCASGGFALPIPPSFSDLDAAPLLCGGVIGYRSLKRSGIAPGGRLGLYGFGASALLTLQVARHRGCEVFVCTRSAREQQRARELGAAWAGGYDDRPPALLDAAITFAPAGAVVIAALRALDRGGVVAINAIHLDRIPEFSYDDLWLEREIRSVANFTREDAREFLDVAAAIPIRPEYEVHPLAAANLALQRLKAGQVSGAAVLEVPRA
jgi:propanol-preferring alcohol dehydrogenase